MNAREQLPRPGECRLANLPRTGAGDAAPAASHPAGPGLVEAKTWLRRQLGWERRLAALREGPGPLGEAAGEAGGRLRLARRAHRRREAA